MHRLDRLLCFSSKLLRALRRNGTGALLLITVAALPSAGWSQVDVPQPLERQQKVLDEIERGGGRLGPESTQLIESLGAWSSSRAADGDIDSAVVAAEQARQAVRANFGPHSLRQAPFIRQLMHYEETADNHRSAWALETELLELALRHADDLDSVPILHEIGDTRMTMLRRYLAGDLPPQIAAGCYYDWEREQSAGSQCSSGGKDDAIRAVVADVQSIYASAITTILGHEDYSNEALPELESKFLRNNYWFRGTGPLSGNPASSPYSLQSLKWRQRIESVYDLASWDLPQSYFESPLEQAKPLRHEDRRGEWHQRTDQYHVGRLSLQRRLAYAIELAGPLSEQVDALVRIADWDLIHGHNALAIEGYELAYQTMQELAAESALVEALFSPETPVALPTFSAHPLSPARSARPGVYVDVRFELSRYGRPRKIEILDISPEVGTGAAKSARNELVRLVSEARFRPQTEDGQFAGSSSILVRYALDEASESGAQ